MTEALDGGGMASMRYDTLGKSMAQMPLELPVDVPAELVRHCRVPAVGARRMSGVLDEVRERVAHITLNEPGTRNAMTATMQTALLGALRQAEPEVSVVLLQTVMLFSRFRLLEPA